MKLIKVKPVKTQPCTRLCECKNSLYWNKGYYTEPILQYVLVARSDEYRVYSTKGGYIVLKNSSEPRMQDATKLSDTEYLITRGMLYKLEGKYIEHISRKTSEKYDDSCLNIYDPKVGRIERIRHRCNRYVSEICVAVTLYGGSENDIRLLQDYYRIYAYNGPIGKLLNTLTYNTRGINPKYKDILAQIFAKRELIEQDLAIPRLIRNWQQVLAYAAANDVIPVFRYKWDNDGWTTVKVYKDCMFIYHEKGYGFERYKIGDTGLIFDAVLKYNPSKKELKQAAYAVKMLNVKVEFKEELL